jgi:hypothetical protein
VFSFTFFFYSTVKFYLVPTGHLGISNLIEKSFRLEFMADSHCNCDRLTVTVTVTVHLSGLTNTKALDRTQ